jgi:probable rRNA maturation factor
LEKKIVAINFLKADVAFVPKQRRLLKQWMFKIAQLHQCNIEHLDFIFCTDAYLLNLNQQFLQHDTFTDIITFDYSVASKVGPKAIAGEIYISIERVKENAKIFKTGYINELHRVMIHGVLHLCGFKDKKAAEQAEMRAQEDLGLKVLEGLP